MALGAVRSGIRCNGTTASKCRLRLLGHSQRGGSPIGRWADRPLACMVLRIRHKACCSATLTSFSPRVAPARIFQCRTCAVPRREKPEVCGYCYRRHSNSLYRQHSHCFGAWHIVCTELLCRCPVSIRLPGSRAAYFYSEQPFHFCCICGRENGRSPSHHY